MSLSESAHTPAKRQRSQSTGSEKLRRDLERARDSIVGTIRPLLAAKQELELCLDYMDGASLKALAYTYGLRHEHAVYHIVRRKYGCPTRNKQKTPR